MGKRALQAGAGEVSSSTKHKVTIEAVAEKCLKDNCITKGGFNTTDCYVTKIGEATFFSEVCDDLRMKDVDKTFKMGGKYWKQKKEKWAPKGDVRSTLLPPSNLEIITPALMVAMVATKRTRPDHTAMVAYISACLLVLATELVGICKWFLSLNPNCERQLVFCMAFLRFVRRLGLHTGFGALQKYVKATAKHADKVWCAAWVRARPRMRLIVWINLHLHDLVVTLPEASLTAVVAAIVEGTPLRNVKNMFTLWLIPVTSGKAFSLTASSNL